MVKDAETPSSTSKSTPEVEEDDVSMESYTPPHTSCSFYLPCFGPRPSPARCGTSSSPSVWERLQQTAVIENKWWAGPLMGLKKVREWSEIVAGPKWKTFIRRFNNRSAKPVGSASGKFNYDPLSYSLNFDDGPGQNRHFDEDDGYFPDFSSRFASIPSFCRTSMDLGKSVTTST